MPPFPPPDPDEEERRRDEAARIHRIIEGSDKDEIERLRRIVGE